jgi:5-bromo-4-chloroindolyl phosphate hydrolysis protein
MEPKLIPHKAGEWHSEAVMSKKERNKKLQGTHNTERENPTQLYMADDVEWSHTINMVQLLKKYH